ncbi:hypothetical protein FRB94_011252 [Tulasnella sp. JGI-2019a]|nr:hypothetical protein FRB93_002891 [Tulasnella sp. JGI-2019a]KAG8992877.1 hypothetical protein FRB94_011252 [Tulasnella sp. JGI-2019a]KAG9025585.1 hypothetical protein FRB95_009982 [Tulasnella sp. JGI-2019a]
MVRGPGVPWVCGSKKPVGLQVAQMYLASNPNIVLDLAGDGNTNGVKICLYGNRTGDNQQWKFTRPWARFDVI